MLISIIIPIYKVEPYIVRCIESVLQQTYRNLEVILVDDCTPDRSMELAKECIEQSSISNDLTFTYLKHEQNRGLSAARNTGMDAATGDYIYFLDSDDAIEQHAMEVLISAAIKYKYPDMIVGNIQIIGNRDDLKQASYKNGYYEGNAIIRNLYYKGIPYGMAWNKMIRFDFLKSNHMQFVEGIIFEDNPWSFFIANKLLSMVICSQITYFYYLRSDSIMSILDNGKKEKRYTSLMRIIKEYNCGFKDKRLYCNTSNYIFFARLKYDTITEIIQDGHIALKTKIKFFYTMLCTKGKFQFIRMCIELWTKRIIWIIIQK